MARGYISFRGLLVVGMIDHAEDGIYQVPSLTLGGTTFEPCYVKIIDDVITHYGIQPHTLIEA